MSEIDHYPPFAPDYAELWDDGEFVAEWIWPNCRLLVGTDGESVFFGHAPSEHGPFTVEEK